MLDRWVARTRLTTTRDWWAAYAIIVFFQLLTNGWLTGRAHRAVRPGRDPRQRRAWCSSATAGSVFAPVEDLAFGFALVLTTCVVWVWLGRRSGDEVGDETGDEREEAA